MKRWRNDECYGGAQNAKKKENVFAGDEWGWRLLVECDKKSVGLDSLFIDEPSSAVAHSHTNPPPPLNVRDRL